MATATKSQQKSTGNQSKPAYTSRHRRLQIAVWQNSSAKGTYFNASLQRSYQDGKEWKRSQSSLNRDDLLVVAKLLNWAHSAVNVARSSDATPPAANRPVSSQRYRNLEVAVWHHAGDERAFFTVSLKRSYKVEEKWNDSTISLGNEDLLPMARLLERAHDAIDDLYETGDFGSDESKAETSGSMDDIPF